MHKKIIRGDTYYYTTIRASSGATETIYLGKDFKEAKKVEARIKGNDFRGFVFFILLFLFFGFLSLYGLRITGYTIFESRIIKEDSVMLPLITLLFIFLFLVGFAYVPYNSFLRKNFFVRYISFRKNSFFGLNQYFFREIKLLKYLISRGRFSESYEKYNLLKYDLEHFGGNLDEKSRKLIYNTLVFIYNSACEYGNLVKVRPQSDIRKSLTFASRKEFWLFIFLLFVSLGGFLGYSYFMHQYTGKVTLDVNLLVSPGAILEVDGVARLIPSELIKINDTDFYNITSFDLELEPGNHTVRIIDKGNIVFEQNVFVEGEAVVGPFIENVTIPSNITPLEIINVTSVNATAVQIISEGVLIPIVEINKPVKWRKIIRLNESKSVALELPMTVENIKVNKIEERFQTLSAENVSFEVNDVKKELFLNLSKGKYEILYDEEGPKTIEENITHGKRVTVYSEVHYENVFTYAGIPEITSDKSRIKLYLIVNNSRKLEYYTNLVDEDGNGLIDRVEWVTPYLSNQTYEIIIEISKAIHLDSNRNYISDIYNFVNAQDNNWSEPIYNKEYIRVTFMKELDSSRDITIYARNNQSLNTYVEVYGFNSSNLITKFPVITREKSYKVYLTGMVGVSDVFDLKVVNEDNRSDAYLEFDYIVDPPGCDYTTDTCKDTGWNPGVTCLTSSISESGSTCMNINSPDVILDCQGRTIDGNDGGSIYGVYLGGNGDNVTIKSCVITDFNRGVFAEGGVANIIFNATIFNSTLNSNARNIYFTYANNFSIINNTISGSANNDNVYVEYSDWGLIANNTITLAEIHGINLYYSDQNNISRNNISFNGNAASEYGVYLYSSCDKNYIYDNYFENMFNVYDAQSTNNWNTSFSCNFGTNILGGNCIGGNYFNDSFFIDHGKGMSPYHNTSGDNIADDFGYNIFAGTGVNLGVQNTDYLPLSKQTSGCTIPRNVSNFVVGNVTLCTGTYYIDPGSTQGAINVYVSNVYIDCNGSVFDSNFVDSDGYGIRIWDTGGNDNVSITNCTFIKYDRCIASVAPVSNLATNLSILNSNLYDCEEEAIYLDYTHSGLIRNVYINGSGTTATLDYAISLSYSNMNTITNNTLYNNLNHGIYMYYSDQNNISTNNITLSGNAASEYGLYSSSSCDKNYFYDNYFENMFNVYDAQSTNNWNVSYSCGRVNILGGNCTGGNYYNDTSFIDHGKGMSPYHNTSGDNISDDLGYHIFAGTGVNLGVQNTDYLPLSKTNSGCSVLRNVSNAVIGNATLCTNTYYIDPGVARGTIDVYASDAYIDCNGSVFDSTLVDSDGYGVRIFGNANDNVIIYNCTFSMYDRCITTQDAGATDFARNISILNSNLYDCEEEAIFFSYTHSGLIKNNYINGSGATATSDYAVSLSNSNTNTIINNTIYNNLNPGVYLATSDLNNISTNNITLNGNSGGEYGITADSGSDNNFIYDNYINCSWSAVDLNVNDSNKNKWFISKTGGPNIVTGKYLAGNYWANYTVTDSGRDDIGDVAYSYGSYLVDLYPLVIPSTVWNAPVVNSIVLNSTYGTNTKNENITLYYNVSDIDGDNIRNITSWFRNGYSVFLLNMPFEGVNGSSINNTWDYSGLGNDGGGNMNPTWSSDGGHNGGGMYNFTPNQASTIVIPYDHSMNVSNFSVSFWVNFDDAQCSSGGGSSLGTSRLITKLNMNTNWEFQGSGTDPACTISFYLVGVVSSTATAIVKNKWYHVVGAHNGTHTLLYIDGVLRDSDDVSGRVNHNFSSFISDKSIVVGDALTTGSYRHLNGSVDDITIWNRSLSAVEVLVLNNSGMGTIVSNELLNRERWKGCVTPNDGYYDGPTACSINLTIDTRPVVNYAILNSTLGTNTTAENLTLYYNVSDIDGDNIRNITSWFRNGYSVLLLNMPFEGVNGSSINNTWDYSGLGNDGGGNMNPAWSSDGGYNGWGMYNFTPNQASTIVIPYDHSMNVSNFSVSFWVNFDGAQCSSGGGSSLGTSRLITKLNMNTNWEFQGSGTDPACTISFYLVGVVSSTATAIVKNKWYHVVGAHNGTHTLLYIDGVLRDSDDVSGRVNHNFSSFISDKSIVVGDALTTGSYRHLNGSVDDITIWNRSLSAVEVLVLNNSGMGTIVSNELLNSEGWKGCVTPNDGYYDGPTTCSNNVTIVSGNEAPYVANLLPVNASSVTDRLVNFTWQGTDPDGDTISYNFQLDDNEEFTSLDYDINTSNTWYNLTSIMTLDDVYYWRVRVNDTNGGYSTWNLSYFNYNSQITVSLPTTAAVFELDPGSWDNTSDNSPSPIQLRNDGNCLLNMTFDAEHLFESILFGNNYQYKADNRTEIYSFNWTFSQVSWTNVGAANNLLIHLFDYLDDKDLAELDVHILVPSDEPPAMRNSTLTITSVLASKEL